MRRIVAVFVSAAALWAAAACSIPTGLLSVAGRYTLVTVDGESLPVASPGSTVELTAGVFNLHSDNTCGLSLTYTTGVETDTCQWARAGSTLTVTWSDGRLAFMTFLNDRITETLDGRVFVFER